MANEFALNQFSVEYINDLVKLIHTTVKKCYPLCYAPEVIDFFLDYHKPEELLRKAKKGTVLTIHKNSNIVATGYLVENELGGVYIHPDFQKQGLGTLMVQELLNIAKNKKLNFVWLDSTPFAVSLYKHFGFTVTEEKVMYVENNTPLQYYLMKKNLI